MLLELWYLFSSPRFPITSLTPILHIQSNLISSLTKVCRLNPMMTTAANISIKTAFHKIALFIMLSPFLYKRRTNWKQPCEGPASRSLSWVGGSVQMGFDSCFGTKASGCCPSAATRGSQRTGQGENFHFRFHFLYWFMCMTQIMVPSAVCFLLWRQIQVLLHLWKTDMIWFET